MKHQPVILYVEDDPMSRRVMSMLLQGRLGLQNAVFWEDSADFLGRIATLDPKPDVIFLDIHVEPFDGFEMLAMLRDSGSFHRTPIVALTASVMNEEIQQLRSAGFNGCLAKPLDLATFAETLDRILNGEFIWHIIH